MIPLNCVVTGPPKCGKTSLITKYMTGRFQNVAANSGSVVVNYDINFVYHTSFDDVHGFAGGDAKNWNFLVKLYDYDLYNNNNSLIKDEELNKVHSVILCYDSSSSESMDLLQNYFLGYINVRWPGVPVILVGCLSDLNGDSKDGFEFDSIQCSALNDEQRLIDDIFLQGFKLAARYSVENSRETAEDDSTSGFSDDSSLTESINSSASSLRAIPSQSTAVLEDEMRSTSKHSHFLIGFLLILSIIIMNFYCYQDDEACYSIYTQSKVFLNTSMDSINKYCNELVIHASDLFK